MADNTGAPSTPAADATPAVPSVNPAKSEVVKVDENGVAAEAPKKMWKLNVNGKEMEYDASDEKRLQNDIQKVFGIEEKAKTTAQKVEASEKLLTMIQTDPKGFAKQCKAMGLDAQKLATDLLYEQIRLNSLSPEQRELEEYKEKEAEALATKQAEEAQSKIKQSELKTQEWAAKFEKDCSEALASNKIPKTRLSLALIAQYVDAGLSQKKDYTVEQVLPWVQRDLKAIHENTMGQLDGDALLDYIGETMSNKIAKARVDRYKRLTNQKTPEAPKSAPKTAKGEDISKLKGNAYFRALRKQKSEDGIGFLPGRE